MEVFLGAFWAVIGIAVAVLAIIAALGILGGIAGLFRRRDRKGGDGE